MALFGGIDIGSRSIELVVRDPHQVISRKKTATTFDPQAQIRRLSQGLVFEKLVATGYGRALVEKAGICPDIETITEIKAYGLGAHDLFPLAQTVLDIGGQDTKAIALMGSKVAKFEMNDRCAAGTGKFLEHLATVFQIPLEEFGHYALEGSQRLEINAMCTVFAETEAVSLMARGTNPHDIALGLHSSIVKRTLTMLTRVGANQPLLFAGGVANNPCVIQLLTEALGSAPLIPEEPEMVGAHGAALHAIR
ncbi:3-hydroxyacyl-ACP dehydratase [Desulfobulbus rhabdoformis]|jgi:predicted CoA-substrate-specific enzyme activase|uniref:acyl-CoA dehydratase activase n=1 Tax=Desulfobulbus rhabdoformis TaxID=34032 RepID=UPI0019624B7D|nr:acyl-CoA dehydratase activase [Desulfobulbus rhabdoformis]MBM9613234.1 3-hydroxyacyl-ACP dehydratase [Desulfobulbus rhabdoformis]